VVKKDALEPGMMVATKAHDYRSSGRYSSAYQAMMAGKDARPALVLGVGRYRTAKSGLCDRFIELTTWESPSNVAVLRADKTRWIQAEQRYADHTDPATEWRLDVISAASLIPWAEYERRKEEAILAQLDYDAIRQRLAAIRNEIELIMKARGKLEAEVKHISMEESYIEITYERKFQLRPVGTDSLKPLHAEWNQLQERLACKR
jgi:hypothetical protein